MPICRHLADQGKFFPASYSSRASAFVDSTASKLGRHFLHSARMNCAVTGFKIGIRIGSKDKAGNVG